MPCVLKTCSRANVPWVLTCSHVPTFLACLRAHVPWVLKYVLTYQHALCAYVLTCLECLRAHVPTYLACLLAHVPTSLACLRALPAYVLMCQHINFDTTIFSFTATVAEVVHTVSKASEFNCCLSSVKWIHM